MKFFKKKIKIVIDEDIVKLAIKEAESKINAEIVPIVFKQSDNYPGAHFRLSLTLILLSTALLYYVPWEWSDPVWFLWIQIPASLFGYFLAFRPSLKRFFSTGNELDEEVRQKALELFFDKGLHLTSSNNTILIFVSLLEKRIEIIPDALFWNDYNSKDWNKIIKHMSREIKKADLTTAISKAINEIIDLVIEKHPIKIPEQKLLESNPQEVVEVIESKVINNEIEDVIIVEDS